MQRLQNKVGVITGASSGVGRAIALALAAEGAHLALLGRNAERLREVKFLCTRNGASSVRTYRVDLLSDRRIERFGKNFARDFTGIDVLVHCAGVIRLGRVVEARLEDFDLQYRCNVRAPFALTQSLLPKVTCRQGQIIFINSTAGLVAAAGVSQYAATKHALKAVADSLRDELNSKGVRVLSIYPGRTATPMQASLHEEEGKVYFPERLIQPEQIAAAVIDAAVMGREAEITDIRIRPTLKPGVFSSGSKK